MRHHVTTAVATKAAASATVLLVGELMAAVTVERIERAIAITAEAMARHNLPQLLPTLKRLEAERDKLIANGDPIAYAKRVLRRQSRLIICAEHIGTSDNFYG